MYARTADGTVKSKKVDLAISQTEVKATLVLLRQLARDDEPTRGSWVDKLVSVRRKVSISNTLAMNIENLISVYYPSKWIHPPRGDSVRLSHENQVLKSHQGVPETV